ncbi:MAG: FAD-dependent oxidoreductase [Spirochaetaceae bacterium]|jgi:thioredoxin reductase (NADPH)|nr:FAD-dependent oxidoreductase [Spirochaetaceae bacterium]
MQKVDLLIVGAGPAGLTAAQYGARAGLRVLVFEQDSVGGQALLIDNLENYPGNTAGKSGKALVLEMHKQAMDFGAEFSNSKALALSKNSDWTLVLEGGEQICSAAVILASGASHNTLDVPGEQEFSGNGVSYCAACDGPFFKNKKIFVVGGGDSACDEARFLSNLSSKITVLHRRDKLKAQKSIAKRVLNDPAIKVRLNTAVSKIKGSGKVESIVIKDLVSGNETEESADAVFVFTGIVPRNELFLNASAGHVPKVDSGGFIVTNQLMATSLQGLFAAGDVCATPFRQVCVACGQGALAAYSAAQYIEGLRK